MNVLSFLKLKNRKTKFLTKPLGSLLGFAYNIIIGTSLYFLLNIFENSGKWLDYSIIISNLEEGNIFYKFIWMIMNFTDPQFYAGVFASAGLIIGGFVAYILAIKDSKYSGIEICYGLSRMWPWVFAAQLLSVAITIFIFDFTRFITIEGITWLPTFITIVAVPPSLMLIYGPSYKALFTSSILAALLSFPIAFWIMIRIIPILGIPGVVGNVLTMAITGIIIGQLFKVLPWIKKIPIKHRKNNEFEITLEERYKRMSKPSWSVRRVLADFSEAQFYGNEIAGLFILIGVSIDWISNSGHVVYGNFLIPEIILSQFIASAIGVLLYFNKFVEDGWYGTYVPVVSTGPGCILLFGGSMGVIVTAGILGGILGGPIAEYIAKQLPEDIHVTVANVSSMAITTTIVAVVIKAMPWI